MLTPDPEQPCCALLIADHRACEMALSELEALIQQGVPYETLLSAFVALKLDLYRHFAAEEVALFPVLSMYRPMVLLEVEHEDLLTALHAFEEALQHQSESMPDKFAAFNQTLRAHIYEEDSGVFSLAEEALEPEEKALVARKLSEAMRHFADHPEAAIPALHRGKPVASLKPGMLFAKTASPISYKEIFAAEQTSLHRIRLKAGQGLKRHWGAQHQCLLVLEGELTLTTDAETRTLKIGDQVNLSPKCPFALQTEPGCEVLLLKVWPRPNLLRS